MDKYLFLILGILLVLPLIFAQTYQMQTAIDLKVPFEVNGSIPSATASCNISVDYPDGTYLEENASMTNRDNGDFNITLISSEINQLGEYEWRAFCCDGIYCAAGYGNFKVNATGDTVSSVLQNQVLIIFIVLGSLMIILASAFDFPSFGFIGSLAFLLSGIHTMIYGLSNTINLYTRGIAISLIGLGFIFMFFSVYEWMFKNADEDY